MRDLEHQWDSMANGIKMLGSRIDSENLELLEPNQCSIVSVSLFLNNLSHHSQTFINYCSSDILFLPGMTSGVINLGGNDVFDFRSHKNCF